MNPKHLLYNNPGAFDWRADDEDENEEQPKSDLMMFNKRLENIFLNAGVSSFGVLWMINQQKM